MRKLIVMAAIAAAAFGVAGATSAATVKACSTTHVSIAGQTVVDAQRCDSVDTGNPAVPPAPEPPALPCDPTVDATACIPSDVPAPPPAPELPPLPCDPTVDATACIPGGVPSIAPTVPAVPPLPSLPCDPTSDVTKCLPVGLGALR